MSASYISSILVGVMCIVLVQQPAQDPVQKDSIKKLYTLSYEALKSYDYENSIQYSLELVDLASQCDDYYHLYHGYNILGITYEDRNDTARARDNYIKALEYAQASGNDTILWWAYNNLGNIYSLKKETVEIGFEYYDKAIEVAMELNDPESALTPVVNKAWTHLDYEQYDRAYPYLVRTKDLLETGEDTLAMSQVHTLFGRYYSGKGDFESAESFFEEALDIVERESFVVQAADTYKAYAKMLLESGRPIEAYSALEKHLEYQSKIFEEEKLHQMEAAYTRYETDEYRKNLEVAEREQAYKDEVIAKSQQTTLIMVISIAVMLLFLVLLYVNSQARKRLINQLRDKNNELIAAKEEAERLSLLKTRFFSTVSHELRTPLYGVVGLTSLLLEDNKDERQIEDLKSLKFSADYLLALINDVLQMNKMESNLVQIEDIPFNIEELLQGMIKSFEFTRIQNDNQLDLQIDPEIPKNLIGDSVRLSQIIMNLVGNAIKFTERGKVWIKAECRNCDEKTCAIYFEIGDTGVGIPENKQREIFEEFSQLRSNNYSYQGTGLGLPIVEKLLELFNSDIHLVSKEGKGSVFSFEITFKRGAQTVKKAVDGTLDISPVRVQQTALIVDDNRINQVVTQRILEKREFACEIANDGYEAIEKIRNTHFDVVLMDVNMPGVNGMETTQRIREFNKDIPIIALTAVEIDEMREEILKSGMNDIIVKPYDAHQFFHTVFRNLLVPAS